MWATMFGSPEQPMETPREMVPAFHEAAAVILQERQKAAPPIWLPVRPPMPSLWALPSAQEIASQLRSVLDVRRIFETVAETRGAPNFRDLLVIYAMRGQPLAVPIEPVAYRELYSEFAQLFGIPWEFIQSFFEGVRTQEESTQAETRLWETVFAPMIILAEDAFRLLAPREIPGYFTIAFDDSTGAWWLYYVEPLLEQIPQLPAPRGGISA